MNVIAGEVQEVSAWGTAMEMIKEGLRPPIVHAATGLCRNRLRSLYRALHGRSAAQGRVSEYAHNRIKNKSQAQDAMRFFQSYYKEGGDQIFLFLDPNLVLEAYRGYKRGYPENSIDATTAWYIARDIREKVLKPMKCKLCGTTYLYDERSDHMIWCPLCGE